MEIFISDIKCDGSSDMAVGEDVLQEELKSIGVACAYDLEDVLIALVKEIKKLREDKNVS